MKSIYVFLIALLSLLTSVKAQNQKIRSIIRKLLVPTERTFFQEDQNKHAFLTYSFAISINSKGIVDSVNFSNTINDNLKQYVDVKKINQQLKGDTKSFVNYKNTLFFGMVMITNGEENYLNPTKGLYPAWPNLLSNLSTMLNDKKLIVLDPVLQQLYFKIIN